MDKMDGLETLPTALGWSVLHFGLGAFLGWFRNHLDSSAWRKAALKGDLHWTELARLAWPARTGTMQNLVFIPALLWLTRYRFFPDASTVVWLEILGGFSGCMLASYPLERRLFPALTWKAWLHHVAANWGYRVLFGGAFLACMFSMPPTWGWSTVLIGAAFLAFMVFLHLGGAQGYLRLIGFLVPADDRLKATVEEMVTRTGIPVRRVWVMESVTANALAWVTTGELSFTRTLLDICTREELEAICSHELGHLSESKTVIAGRILAGLWFFPMLFIQPVIHSYGLSGLFGMGLSALAILILGRKLSQAMEKRADAIASGTQQSEGVYASALEKIYRANLIPAVQPGKNSTHPHLYDRMLAAGVTPGYPRPLPPPRTSITGWILRIGLGVLVGLAVQKWRHTSSF